MLKTQNFIYNILVLIVCLSPLPFASNREWSWSLLALLVSYVFVVFIVNSIIHKNIINFPLKKIKYIFILFMATVFWSVFQIIPISEDYANPLWQEISNILNVKVSNTISIDTYQTITSIIKLLAYGMIFFLALQYGKSSKNVSNTFKALAFTGVAYALYGLYVQLSGSNTILWYERWAYDDVLTSTFINRNSYATFAGMGIIINLGIFLSKLFRNCGNLKGKPFYEKLINNLFNICYNYFYSFIINWFQSRATFYGIWLYYFISFIYW